MTSGRWFHSILCQYQGWMLSWLSATLALKERNFLYSKETERDYLSHDTI